MTGRNSMFTPTARVHCQIHSRCGQHHLDWKSFSLNHLEIPHNTESDKASSHLNCRSCWVFFLTNLKSVLENKYDLREQDPNLSDCVSVHFEPPVI